MSQCDIVLFVCQVIGSVSHICVFVQLMKEFGLFYNNLPLPCCSKIRLAQPTSYELALNEANMYIAYSLIPRPSDIWFVLERAWE